MAALRAPAPAAGPWLTRGAGTGGARPVPARRRRTGRSRSSSRTDPLEPPAAVAFLSVHRRGPMHDRVAARGRISRACRAAGPRPGCSPGTTRAAGRAGRRRGRPARRAARGVDAAAGRPADGRPRRCARSPTGCPEPCVANVRSVPAGGRARRLRSTGPARHRSAGGSTAGCPRSWPGARPARCGGSCACWPACTPRPASWSSPSCRPVRPPTATGPRRRCSPWSTGPAAGPGGAPPTSAASARRWAPPWSGSPPAAAGNCRSCRWSRSTRRAPFHRGVRDGGGHPLTCDGTEHHGTAFPVPVDSSTWRHVARQARRDAACGGGAALVMRGSERRRLVARAGGGRLVPRGMGPGGRGRRPGGRVVRVTPEGVVTCRVPSASMTNCQPRAKVFSRWWLRHRQHRLVQSVSPRRRRARRRGRGRPSRPAGRSWGSGRCGRGSSRTGAGRRWAGRRRWPAAAR